MQQHTKPAANVTSGKPSSGDAAKNDFAATAKMFSPGAVEAIMDIAKRSGPLLHRYAENLMIGGDHQMIDARTVASTFQEFVQCSLSGFLIFSLNTHRVQHKPSFYCHQIQ